MHDRGATAAVVECSAKGIATGATDWLSPDIVVFTNSSDNPAKLELFDSKEVGSGGLASNCICLPVSDCVCH